MVIPPPQLNVYPGVPPEGVKLIAPVVPPLQAIFVTTVLPFNKGGCVIVKFLVATVPDASVIVHMYVPATKPDAVAVVPPEGDQLYEYGVYPPETTTLAVPLEPPLQETFV